MRFRRVIKKPVAVDEDGVQIAGGINAVVAGSINESGRARVRSKQKIRVVQRNGRTEIFEESTTTEGDDDE